MNWNRLPLKNAYNIRDLGGYESNNKQTKYHEIIRADDISNLTQDEIQFLKEYGIKTIIDLRSEKEVININPYIQEFEYYNISLIQNLGDISKIATKKFEMSALYIQIIEESKELIKEILTIIANTKNGVLFHCTAGKDRTGIIAMLILSILEVPKQDVITNYEVTYTNIKNNPTFKHDQSIQDYLYSKPQYIETTIEHMIYNYGSIKKYLVEIGLSLETIDLIKRKLV